MITVQVYSRSTGKPLSGKRVYVYFSGLLRGGLEGYTDRNGEVHLNADPGDGEVYVSGSKVHTGYLCGKVVVYS
ncbi:MAG: hypothetical protein ACOYIS_03230 [Candidatus Cloacimonadaceae bacterium]|jgi:hypothetical protein